MENEVMVNDVMENGSPIDWIGVANIALKGAAYGLAAGGGLAAGYHIAEEFVELVSRGKGFVVTKINERKEKKAMKPIEVITEE